MFRGLNLVSEKRARFTTVFRPVIPYGRSPGMVTPPSCSNRLGAAGDRNEPVSIVLISFGVYVEVGFSRSDYVLCRGRRHAVFAKVVEDVDGLRASIPSTGLGEAFRPRWGRWTSRCFPPL
jgi:hypothetical protein